MIDGPSADVIALGGMAIARDGTGGIVYVKQVNGVAHVFLSGLTGGAFGAPVQIDGGLAAASAQPVIAAANDGLLTIAFVNGGSLYVVTRPSAATALTAPQDIFDGASNPAISITTLGKAYVAFTAGASAPHDVRAAYYYLGRWALEPTPLQAVPGEDSGSGTGRPAVAAAGDGVAIVAWGENGHIFTRRVWGTSSSPAFEQADPPMVAGLSEVSADKPAVSAGADSSYADVAFHERFSEGGGVTQSRVLVSRLRASRYDPMNQVDGVSAGGSGGADDPQVALGEGGRGFVTSERTDNYGVIAAHAGTNGAIDDVFGVNSAQGFSPPDPVPGIAGLTSTLIAYQYDPGPLGSPDIRVRYAADGHSLDPEMVLSASAQGPADAAGGLAAGGDVYGDAAAAWIQGPAGARAVVVGQLYQPPGGVVPLTPFAYLRTPHPTLAWTAARSAWGPVSYTVTVDGVAIGTTTGISTTPPAALTDGRHSWQVVAHNPAGVTSVSPSAAFFTDTLAPVVTLAVSGKLVVGKFVHATAAYTDTAPPEVPGGSSGIAAAAIRFGDGSQYVIRHGKFHAYRRAGRYRVTATVVDRAGNQTTVSQLIRITSSPKSPGSPKSRKPSKGKVKK